MKRFLLIGTLFCTAALIGLGIGLFLPPDVEAGICAKEERQIICNPDDPACGPILKAGVYNCGTYYGGQPYDTCDCYFVGCYRGCPEPI